MSQNQKFAKQPNTQAHNTVRPPIVTIMGHVDHGKTSILDYIRKANVAAKEYGGITQHIGAYQITYNQKLITFIDTPGHEAFSQMRARGGKTADIVVLVVAADSGVQPQTKEAIAHARAANCKLMVAINKIDLPQANTQKVKQDLAQENVLVEDWGGDIVCVEVSAKTGKGIDTLLDSILVVAELMDLHADPNSELEAVIIEAKLDKRRGPTVTAIIKSGTLRVTDEINACGIVAKVKSLLNDLGKPIEQALPAMPVEILGFKDVPRVGDIILQKGSDLLDITLTETKIEIVGQATKRTVGLILKADTQGTLEAIKASLAKLVTESVNSDFSIKFVFCTTGEITDSDVLLANNTGSMIVGFNVAIQSSVPTLAEDLKINVKTYKTIYELIDEVKSELEGTAVKDEQKVKGRAQILKTFKLESGDLVAGCKVVAGVLKEGGAVSIYLKNPAELTPDDTPIYSGKIKKIKIGKNEVQTAAKNMECGLLFKPQFNELTKDMWLELK